MPWRCRSVDRKVREAARGTLAPKLAGHGPDHEASRFLFAAYVGDTL